MPNVFRWARSLGTAPGPRLVLAAAILAVATPLGAQSDSTAVPRKRATAIRVGDGAITVDGRLDEQVWNDAPALTDFVQKQPKEGAEPTERTVVRIAYDAGALYIGARMFAKDPAKIQAPIGRRDNIGQMEHLLVSLDTYLDRRTSYTFGIAASGVRGDWYQASDVEEDRDATYEPVWEARTRIDAQGWTAEMRIPFSQLRFNDKSTQVWGINFDRWIPSTNEDIFWIAVPQNVTAWASRFGDLHGIDGVRSSRQIEMRPYIAGQAKVDADRDPRNPFDDGRNLGARFGSDFKIGLGSSLTLQATVNPDFGQVEADPSVVNLSAFDIFYAERRPFFTEGSGFLTNSGPTLFYSRRIGGMTSPGVLTSVVPSLGSADYTDYPQTATILGAAKLTGRTQRGTSIGALAAVTDEEEADLFFVASGTESASGRSVLVAPRSYYGIGRVQQELGKSGSTAGASVTLVERDVADDSELARRYTRQAVSGGIDYNFRLKGGEYELGGSANASLVRGDTGVMRYLQTRSSRYYQRPDADYVEVDPAQTSLSGYDAGIAINRISGRHWLGGIQGIVRSPGFEVNDAGAMSAADFRLVYGELRYRERTPNRLFQNYQVLLSSERDFDFGGAATFGFVRADANLTWKNFWFTNLTAWNDFPGDDPRIARGGPYVRTGHGRVMIFETGNPTSAKTRWSARWYNGMNTLGGRTYRLSGQFSARPTPQWQFTLTPNYLGDRDPRFFQTSLAGGRSETFGRRYVFSTVDLTEFTLSARLNYTVNPDLTLEMFVEPYAANGRFDGFGELLAPGSNQLVGYGPGVRMFDADSNRIRRFVVGGQQIDLFEPEFNERSMRSNFVVRWEWRPGSTFYAVWQQNGGRSVERIRAIRPADVFQSLSYARQSFFALKLDFWVPLGG
jgi:hypothetical protein